MFLTKFASKVYIIHRRYYNKLYIYILIIIVIINSDSLRASKVMQKRVFENSKIQIIWDSQVIKAEGNNKLENIIISTTSSTSSSSLTTTTNKLNVNGMFYAIGHIPNTNFMYIIFIHIYIYYFIIYNKILL